MPRKPHNYTNRVVTIYESLELRNHLVDTKIKHQLIATLIYHYKISQRKVIRELREAFNKTSSPIDPPLQPAYSTYAQKHPSLAIKQGITPYDLELTIKPTQIKIGKPKKYSRKITITFNVKDSDIKPWYQRNADFIHKLNFTINNDENHIQDGLSRIIEAVAHASPENERHKIERTEKWYKKNINKITFTPKSRYYLERTPISAELLIIKQRDDQLRCETGKVLLLLKSHDLLGYIPVVVNAKNNPNDKLATSNIEELFDAKATYKIVAIKRKKRLTIELDISYDRKITSKKKDKTPIEKKTKREKVCYAISIFQHLDKPSKHSGETIFNTEHVRIFNDDIPDGEYVITQETPLEHSFTQLDSKKGRNSRIEIENTLSNINEVLSTLKIKTRDASRKNFTAYKATFKLKADANENATEDDPKIIKKKKENRYSIVIKKNQALEKLYLNPKSEMENFVLIDNDVL